MRKTSWMYVLLVIGTLFLAACSSDKSTSTSTTPSATDLSAPFPNPSLLVSGAALNLNATNQVIIDTRSATKYNGTDSSYTATSLKGHIPGAINFNPSTLDTTTTSGVLDVAGAAAKLGAAGISNTKTIIIYGDKGVDAPTGRLFWALEYLGATDVHVLDGGYNKWTNFDGRAVVTAATTLTATTFTPSIDATRIATAADVSAHMADTTNYAILDNRPSSDFRAAKIPNAINMSPTDFLERDSSVLVATKIRWMLDFMKVSGKKVIIYDTPSGSSAGAGVGYFMLRLMNFDVKVYGGSWNEWNAATPYPNAGLLVDKTALASPSIVIDARSTTQYAAGHIPGAINVIHNDYWTAGTGLKALATLESQLGAAGLTRTSKIVIYDDTTASWGAAGRLFWMLEYLGCTDVHILNGGWDKWVADTSNTASTTATTLTATTFTSAVVASKKVGKADIAANLSNSNFALIDARTKEEFNGWQLYGETRGGHIPGAYILAYPSFFNADKTTLNYQTLKQMLESRGITTDKQVAAYCTAGIRSGYAYFILRLMGYTQAANYDASMFEWSAADATTYPEEKSAHYQELVYPAWVKGVIDYSASGSTTAIPPQYKDATGTDYPRTHKYIILESSWDTVFGNSTWQYLGNDKNTGASVNGAGHIPGAIHSNTDNWEIGPLYVLKNDAQIAIEVGKLGIDADTTVIVYSDAANFSARLWWLLKYIGVKDVRLLNGGTAAWKTAGYAFEKTVRTPTLTTFTGTINSSIRKTMDWAVQHYTDSPSPLYDTRGLTNYLGIYSGYVYTNIAGRIPNANYMGSVGGLTDPDGTYKSYTEVKAAFAALGIKSTAGTSTLDHDVAFYCGDSYGASQDFLLAYLIGYTNVATFTDGWNTWSSYIQGGTLGDQGLKDGVQIPSGRPIAVGLP